MSTQTAAPIVTVKITETPNTTMLGKLADAELIFTEAAGPLAGLRLVGFGVWARKDGSGRNVTFPARTYSVNAERRAFALLRPVEDSAAQEPIRDLIRDAYARQVGELDNAPELEPAVVDDEAPSLYGADGRLKPCDPPAGFPGAVTGPRLF